MQTVNEVVSSRKVVRVGFTPGTGDYNTVYSDQQESGQRVCRCSKRIMVLSVRVTPPPKKKGCISINCETSLPSSDLPAIQCHVFIGMFETDPRTLLCVCVCVWVGKAVLPFNGKQYFS